MAAWPDQAFLDGRQLRQVSSPTLVGPGQFAVDYGSGTVTIGDDPAKHEVRVSDLDRAWNVIASHVALRGFGVRRYATPLPALGTVRLAGGSDSADDLVIADNATQGLSFQNSGNLADHLTVMGNGMTGIHANNADDLTITNSQVSGNNAEQFNPEPSAAGIKVTASRGVTIAGNAVIDNAATGIWTDQSVVRFTMVGNTVVGNWIGIEVELSETGILASNTVDGGKYGLYVFDTGNVQIFNNAVSGNPIGSVLLSQDERREADASIPAHDHRQPIPDPSCPWLTRNVTVANNIFGHGDSGGLFQFYALDKRTRIPASAMNITVDGNLFSRRNSASDPTMVGWGGADNVSVRRIETPNDLNSALGREWTNMQVSAQHPDASAGRPADTVPLPPEVARAIGVAPGSQHIGPFS